MLQLFSSERQRSVDDSLSRTFLDALELYRVGRSVPTPGNSGSYLIREVAFCLLPSRYDGASVEMHTLRSLRPRNGQGTEVLRFICGQADACGVTLTLKAWPYATEAVAQPMEQARLIRWYEKFGFRATRYGAMVRPPGNP
ncbi:conserved protein of unknown function [Rhodovastum atsumiense]|uniref:GNAT family N-acetyltransferase n=2 Tax=Rhodovastum atsumiense TaxID=504468 RepID=A0A5M6ITB4_9PROT|nr:hypothetical protein [Rhodovastum atsumiense]KAA5611502.1 hypothetical protein F1189_14340 [Rhodovastum atsumiense]CAH2601200.1 conserved protein of unknown function [Rhodovastum atsumiense]